MIIHYYDHLLYRPPQKWDILIIITISKFSKTKKLTGSERYETSDGGILPLHGGCLDFHHGPLAHPNY